MAIALRGSGKKNGSAAASIQSDTGFTTVTGDTFFVALTDPVTSISISDTINGSASGNTWTRAGTQLGAGVVNLNLFYCQNGNGGSNHRFTATASGGTMDAALFYGAISGAATASFDKTAQGTDSSSPFTLTSPTLSQANEIVVVLAGCDGASSTYSESTGFTIAQQETNDALYWPAALATKITSSTSAVTPSFTIAGSVGSTMGLVLATFKEAGGGGVSIAVLAQAHYRRRRSM